jgi:hypothetical protein
MRNVFGHRSVVGYCRLDTTFHNHVKQETMSYVLIFRILFKWREL